MVLPDLSKMTLVKALPAIKQDIKKILTAIIPVLFKVYSAIPYSCPWRLFFSIIGKFRGQLP
jgi:hypothetical protein